MIKKTIFCKVCGRAREVSTNNWKQVTLCKECAYDAKRRANTEYIKKWRAKKKKACKPIKRK